MIAFIASGILAEFVVAFINAHALPIAKHIVIGWVWLYSAIAPKEDREGRRAEVLSHMHDLIDFCLEKGHTSREIAVLILENMVRGAADDVAWGIPFIPNRLTALADRVKDWSEALRHSRVPSAMIAGVATLGPINYALFSSDNRTFVHWLIANGIVVVMTALLWKSRHPLVKRILYSWIGVAIIAAIAGIVWVSIQYHLYETMTFKTFLLAMIAVSPVIIVVDKSWRQRFFRGKWWLIVICWAPFIAGSFAGSLLVAGSIQPLLDMLGVIGMLALGMVILGGITVLAAYGLCWIGIKGSAGGLRILASAIRHLR